MITHLDANSSWFALHKSEDGQIANKLLLMQGPYTIAIYRTTDSGDNYVYPRKVWKCNGTRFPLYPAPQERG